MEADSLLMDYPVQHIVMHYSALDNIHVIVLIHIFFLFLKLLNLTLFS